MHKHFRDYIDQLGVVIAPSHRWIKRRVYGFWGLNLLYVWERDGVEEFRLFNRFVIRRRISDEA